MSSESVPKRETYEGSEFFDTPSDDVVLGLGIYAPRHHVPLPPQIEARLVFESHYIVQLYKTGNYDKLLDAALLLLSSHATQVEAIRQHLQSYHGIEL